MGEVTPKGVRATEVPNSQHGASITYTSADYGSIFKFANITLSAPLAAVAPKMPVELEDKKSPEPRRLFLSSILTLDGYESFMRLLIFEDGSKLNGHEALQKKSLTKEEHLEGSQKPCQCCHHHSHDGGRGIGLG